MISWLKSKLRKWVSQDEPCDECQLYRNAYEGERFQRMQIHEELNAIRSPFPTVDGEKPDWRQEDVDHWRAWLGTVPGQALLAQANFHEQACNRASALRTGADEKSFANNAGFARGWHEATRFFFHILTADIQPKSDDATDDGDEASRLRERLAS